MIEIRNYEDCKYFESEYAGGWHSDVFDHPDYNNYCAKSGKRIELWCARIQCGRCEDFIDDIQQRNN